MARETPTAPPSTVDILIDSYKRVCGPNPFNGGDLSLAPVVRGRMEAVPFAPYWEGMFLDFHTNSAHRNPAGLFTHETLRAAEHEEESVLLRTVALNLAENFGDSVLQADLDLPSVVPLSEGAVLNPLAALLSSARDKFEGFSRKLYAAPREISDSWISFAHKLAEADPERHELLLRVAQTAYTEADVVTDEEMDEEAGMMGGFDEFSKRVAMRRALAGVLASEFPELVVGNLKEAPKYTYTYTDTTEEKS